VNNAHTVTARRSAKPLEKQVAAARDGPVSPTDKGRQSALRKARSRGNVTDRFKIVAVGIDHERRVVVRVIVRSQTRLAVVGRPGTESGSVEGIDRGVFRSG
jgi:hypothetical protein